MPDQPLPGGDRFPERPGVPLASGFEPEHGGRRRHVALSKEARERVLAKMRSVDEARRRAMEAGHSHVIG